MRFRVQAMTYRVSHTVQDGIERVVYAPDRPRFRTTLLMQHGMWHGAWYWRPWQELFAEWGWESHAYSLPGHGLSPAQRPVRWCTFGYYLQFLAAEVNRLPRPPVLIGHSMGGALVQRYLKHVGDLPAAVLVASWPSRTLLPLLFDHLLRDPLSVGLSFMTLSSTPVVRNAKRAEALLLTEEALVLPEELHARLCPESLLVVFQHVPPFWSPPVRTRTPLLWLAGTHDKATREAGQRASAEDYGAAYAVVEGAGHNVMLDKRYREAAEAVQRWLVTQRIS